jgi:hypothetical protein
MSISISPTTGQSIIPTLPQTPPPPPEPVANPTTPRIEDVVHAVIPQEAKRPFSLLKEHVWTELKTLFENGKKEIRSKSYWDVDPRQWVINTAKGILERTENKQKAQLSQATTAQDLLEKLLHIREETIPSLLKMFNGTTNFNPLDKVQRTLESAPELIGQLIKEVRDNI